MACGVYIDLQKPFDMISYSTLLNQLEYYEIRGVPKNFSERERSIYKYKRQLHNVFYKDLFWCTYYSFYIKMAFTKQYNIAQFTNLLMTQIYSAPVNR